MSSVKCQESRDKNYVEFDTEDQVLFKGVAIVFQGSLRFLKCFKVVLRVFQGSFVFLFCFAWQSSKLPKQKEGLLSLVSLECVVHLECVGVSRKFKGCFKEIFRIFQGPFKQD